MHTLAKALFHGSHLLGNLRCRNTLDSSDLGKHIKSTNSTRLSKLTIKRSLRCTFQNMCMGRCFCALQAGIDLQQGPLLRVLLHTAHKSNQSY